MAIPITTSFLQALFCSSYPVVPVDPQQGIYPEASPVLLLDVEIRECSGRMAAVPSSLSRTGAVVPVDDIRGPRPVSLPCLAVDLGEHEMAQALAHQVLHFLHLIIQHSPGIDAHGAKQIVVNLPEFTVVLMSHPFHITLSLSCHNRLLDQLAEFRGKPCHVRHADMIVIHHSCLADEVYPYADESEPGL